MFPESEIILPKVSPTNKEWNELANGHTHLFMICKEAYSSYYILKGEQPSRSYRWNDEAEVKMKVAKG